MDPFMIYLVLGGLFGLPCTALAVWLAKRQRDPILILMGLLPIWGPVWPLGQLMFWSFLWVTVDDY